MIVTYDEIRESLPCVMATVGDRLLCMPVGYSIGPDGVIRYRGEIIDAKNETDIWNHAVAVERRKRVVSGESFNEGQKAIDFLRGVKSGGAIISTSTMSPERICIAKESDRLLELPGGDAYVWVPLSRDFQTESEALTHIEERNELIEALEEKDALIEKLKKERDELRDRVDFLLGRYW